MCASRCPSDEVRASLTARRMELHHHAMRPVGRRPGGQVERARKGLAKRHPKIVQGALEQGGIGHAAREQLQLSAFPESGQDMDGLEAIGVPCDPDGAIGFDQHQPMVGPRAILPIMVTPAPETLDRLHRSPVIWLTTVRPDGQPQTSPVWFLWQDGRFVIYSLADSPRVRNLRQNPRVALNLDGDGQGGAIATFEGTAELDDTGPPSTDDAAYQAKYLALITGSGWTAASFARDYPQRVVVTPSRLRTY